MITLNLIFKGGHYKPNYYVIGRTTFKALVTVLGEKILALFSSHASICECITQVKLSTVHAELSWLL